MSVLKISLSHEDLVRMIGGEETVAVEVRNSIVQEFAKKYLKPLVNDSTLQIARAAMQKDFDAAVRTAVAEYITITESWGGTQYKLIDAVQQRIRVAVQTALAEMLTQTVRELVNDRAEAIRHEIEQRVTAETERRIRVGVTERFQALSNAAAAGRVAFPGASQPAAEKGEG